MLLVFVGFISESFFSGVSQWMMRNVSNSPMSIGSNSVFSAMPSSISFLAIYSYVVVALWILVFEKVEVKGVPSILWFFRFAKRKLDDFVFLGNQLQVSYAPHFESLSDTKDKLEGRRREVLARLNRKFKPYILYIGLLHIIYKCLLRELLQWCFYQL